MKRNTPPPVAETVFLRRTVVVVPAWNEEACVAGCVRYWRARGVALVRVVDNGSVDQTAANAQAAGAEVLHESRRGYGAAAWRGTLQLPGLAQWILFCAADGSDRLDEPEAEAFQRAIDHGADLVLGERMSLAASRGHLRRWQRFGNELCCAVLALGWRHSFRDFASLRVIRREALERLRLEDRGFGWNVEMQIRAVEAGLRIAEVPVRYYARTAGQQKISGHPVGMLRAGCGMLATIARLYASRRSRAQGRPPLTPQAVEAASGAVVEPAAFEADYWRRRTNGFWRPS